MFCLLIWPSGQGSKTIDSFILILKKYQSDDQNFELKTEPQFVMIESKRS